MKNAPMAEAHSPLAWVEMKRRARCVLTVLCVVAIASGCGPAEPLDEPLSLDSQSQELDSFNGLSVNGLSLNGLSLNGLSVNGLSLNGLSSAEFIQWFTQNPASADTLMTYIVRCAVPKGQVRRYTHAATGKNYTWPGGLGLAPDWASGYPASYNDQQLITACLMAHVNRYGRHVNISILGWNAWGTAIPFSFSELTTYSVREACFFGNLFTPNSLFFGVDRPINNEGEYLTRACGAQGSGSGSSEQCAPLRFVGQCSNVCTLGAGDPWFYSNCTFNGVGYRPLTTRMRQRDFDQLFAPSGN